MPNNCRDLHKWMLCLHVCAESSNALSSKNLYLQLPAFPARGSWLQNASHPSGDSLLKDVHSPWALLEETTTVQDTTTLLPALHLLQMSGNLKHWHPTWIATPSQPLTPQNRGEAPSPWSGIGALQQIHGLEGSQQQCFKLNALDDLHCSPALAWQLYFWLNCIFWFANVGSGNISGKTWPQLRMRSFAAHFPWGQHFAHFFKVNTRQNTKYSIPLCISQKKVFKYWRLSKRRKTLFSCAFTNGLNLKNN